MPATNTKDTFLFQKIVKTGRALGINKLDQTKASQWYREKAKEIKTVNINRVLEKSPEYRLRTTISGDMIGQMYLFQYDAKHKATLPYYDQSPLIFVIDVGNGRFMGINMHYISYFRRAQLMNAMYDLAVREKDQIKRLNISYGILKGISKMQYFKPCVKSYLSDHLQSRFLRILPSEWDFVLQLPLQRFVGATAAKVWYDSNKTIRGNVI